MIVDASINVVVAGERFDLDLTDVEAWLGENDALDPVEAFMA